MADDQQDTAEAITPLTVAEIQDICAGARARLITVDTTQQSVETHLPPKLVQSSFTVVTPAGKELTFAFATTTRDALVKALASKAR